MLIAEPAPATGTDELSDTSPHSNDNLESPSKLNSTELSPGTTHTPSEPPDGGEDDDYGEPPDDKGWHAFPIHPKSKKAAMYIAHNGDFEWLRNLNGKFPPGIRTPEGYVYVGSFAR
ncbi:hypothetical protein BU17DRAFT_96136 [Hysterangium stoloniferum]|nr:hypothetical protein BU17DRAFT_96136 [Hysterangium stoloniferum]